MFLTAVVAHADNVPGVPTPAGKVLIIYNERGFGYEFSEGAKGTFHAALTGDLSKLTFQNLGAHPITDMPAISPAPQVDVLNVTKTTGIYDELITAFGGNIPAELSGGRELEYWDLIFDIRFANVQGTAANPASISLGNSPTSDMNLYRTFLTAAGGLYVQAEYDVFKARNSGVTSIINQFTNDTFDPDKITSGSSYQLTTADYSSTPENFNKDFNDLTDPTITQPMVVSGGTYPLSGISGTPLIKRGTDTFLHLWDSKDLVMQNGRLMIGFDINVFGDHHSDYQGGEITAGTFAFIQNIYDLISGIKYYSVAKEFVPSTIDLNDDGTFTISVTNKSANDLYGFTVKDTVSTCLQVNGATPMWDSNVGNAYEWTIDKIPANSTTVITVDYNATQMPPCQ